MSDPAERVVEPSLRSPKLPACQPSRRRRAPRAAARSRPRLPPARAADEEEEAPARERQRDRGCRMRGGRCVRGSRADIDLDRGDREKRDRQDEPARLPRPSRTSSNRLHRPAARPQKPPEFGPHEPPPRLVDNVHSKLLQVAEAVNRACRRPRPEERPPAVPDRPAATDLTHLSLASPPRPSLIAFPERPMQPSTMHRWWSRCLEQAAAAHFPMHELRHSAVTEFLRALTEATSRSRSSSLGMPPSPRLSTSTGISRWRISSAGCAERGSDGQAPLSSELRDSHKNHAICGNFVRVEGAERTRTAVRGFAGLCLTSRPRRRAGAS